VKTVRSGEEEYAAIVVVGSGTSRDDVDGLIDWIRRA
jgi:3-oxoacyl-ACP reductase-like protein